MHGEVEAAGQETLQHELELRRRNGVESGARNARAKNFDIMRQTNGQRDLGRAHLCKDAGT